MNKVIIFDLDNTFYEYEKSHLLALRAVFTSQNYFDSYEEFIKGYEKTKHKVQARLVDNPSRHSKLIYFKDLFNEKIDLKKIHDLEITYWDVFIKSTKIDKGSIKLLINRKESKDFYFLFTNQNTNIQLKKINSWGLNFFDLVITSEEVGFEKPNKKFYDYADSYVAEKVKKMDTKIYVVGDDYRNDIKFWQNKYNARSYLIDNKKLEPLSSNTSVTDSTGESFDVEKEIIQSSFPKAIEDIFEINN